MSITKREKTLIIIVLILVVFFVYYMYFLSPTLKEIDSLSADITGKQLSVSTNEQIQKKITTLNKKVSENEGEIKSYSNGIMFSFDQPAVLVYLQDTISKYANKIMFSFTALSQLGQLKMCPVTITMTANYDNFKKIMESLNDGSYYTKLTGLNIKYSNGTRPPEAQPPADNTGQNGAGTATAPNSPAAKENILDISMQLEFYCLNNDIPADTTYPFTAGSTQYGGDIFY